MDENIEIPSITLRWSEWHSWRDVAADARSGGVVVPNRVAGVYEAKLRDSEERLTIGKTSDLRFRIKQGLVRGKAPHPAGDDIRQSENLADVTIRWAITDRPAAIEEELHRRHRGRFGWLPKYTDF